jgi:hypothetical protein
MTARCAIILPVFLNTAFLAAQPQPDLTAAKSGLSEFQSVCKEAGDRLWGVSLCGRLLLVDPKSRVTVATMPDPEGKFEEVHGLFVGALPPGLLIANTSIRWGSDEWAMVLLPLRTDQFLRLRLLAHESFHRVQSGLGLDASDVASGHLDSESGRLWLRLELRALSQALRLDGAAARSAAMDAVLFRAARQYLNPGANIRESALEIQEGLAEYTGTMVALAASGETPTRVARAVETFEDQPAFSRSFAYATGPALGLLLDRYDSGWRRKLKRDSNPGLLLSQALGFRTDTDLINRAQSRGQGYGFRAVAADEHARATRTQAVLAGYRTRFLDGPVLEFPKTEELRRSFKPNNLVPLDDKGTVYPTGTFVSRWGRLQIDDLGGLLGPDNQSLRVSAPADPSARPLIGPVWRLELAPGWTVRPGVKTGNFVVTPE